MQIEPSSVSYWEQCTYQRDGYFDGIMRTSELPLDDPEKLRQYVSSGFETRDRGVPGEEYYAELKTLAPLLSGKKVLDFGCGQGIDSLYLARQGAVVSSVDIVPSNIALVETILQWHKHSVHLLQDYSEMDGLGMFDLVLSNGCLHHIQDDRVSFVVRQLIDHLNVGGLFLAMVYTREFYPVPNYAGNNPEGPWARGYSVEEFMGLLGPRMKKLQQRVVCYGGFRWFLCQKGG